MPASAIIEFLLRLFYHPWGHTQTLELIVHCRCLTSQAWTGDARCHTVYVKLEGLRVFPGKHLNWCNNDSLVALASIAKCSPPVSWSEWPLKGQFINQSVVEHSSH
jgi:hypothetical protein